MERRKFLIGAGALASGSAAAVGTGAFTSAAARRSVSVEVAGDADAFLGIETDGSEFAEQNDTGGAGTVSLNFDDAATGSGVNNAANTKFNNLLTFRNNGSDPVAVYIDDGNSENPAVNNGVSANFISNVASDSGVGEDVLSESVFFWSYGVDDQGPDFTAGGDDENGVPFSTGFDDDSVLSPVNVSESGDNIFDTGTVRPPVIGPGNSVDLNLQINTNNLNAPNETFDSLFSSSGSVVVNAYTEGFLNDA